jgi:UDP-glucose 4-epimerase
VSTSPSTKIHTYSTYTHFMTPQTWLITGGAGYIGSHVADEFLANGKDVVIYDSLYRGLESRIEYLRKKHNKEIPLVVADIRDGGRFEDALTTHKPYGVIHTAALKSVGESMEKPDEYFEVNFLATSKILEITNSLKIHHFIFSSSAAVYGAPDHLSPVKEEDEKNPVSPYGDSKLAAEREVDQFLIKVGNYGTSLRYFNVIGAAAPEMLDNSAENLVPILINKLNSGQPPVIYGTSYPTQDGTCVRDYIDVRDVARANLFAADFQGALPPALNVGTGRGSSVRKIIELVSVFAGRPGVVVRAEGSRAGDPAFLCADTALIERTFGVSVNYSLEQSIHSLFGTL